MYFILLYSLLIYLESFDDVEKQIQHILTVCKQSANKLDLYGTCRNISVLKISERTNDH